MVTRVYLAGPITDHPQNYNEWRESVIQKLNDNDIIGVDPLRNIQSIYEKSVYTTDRSMFELDVYDVRNADAILVNFLDCKRVSIGTCMEIGIAKENKIPVVIAMEKDNMHNHPFIRECSTIIVNTLEEATDIVIILTY